ncbi:hypothetical protein ADK86_03665 [Streptomyces sp. NRRL F-5755]|uniref:hypothetical protein n=1 Tax=Streptomyces sp. NRRL F-5755 TaxID=1519475 RepID=UPI0006AEC7BA|nr:hypothetical protein [Streptomyces sp. NRRL F-5755]KOU08563.1 hypothetical protein ADK86_03665 [Streptomyces sp. NRRL F-5755]
MWRFRKNLRRYREDPDWHYRKRESRDWVRQFGAPGHPFGPRGNHVKHILEGHIRGYEATLFHLAAVHKGGRPATDVSMYSVAVLALPAALPATVLSPASLVRRLAAPPLPPRAGTPVDLSPAHRPRMTACSTDPAFAGLILTEQAIRRAADTKTGWRLHEAHIIGWIKERKPYERIIELAETLANVVEEFPEAVWGWGHPTPGCPSGHTP